MSYHSTFLKLPLHKSVTEHFSFMKSIIWMRDWQRQHLDSTYSPLRPPHLLIHNPEPQSRMVVLVVQSTLCNPIGYHPPGSSVHGILQARILEWVAISFSRGSSQPRDPTQFSCIAGDSLPAEPQGKPKNTGVGNLSLLQGIFLTQESNPVQVSCIAGRFFTN